MAHPFYGCVETHPTGKRLYVTIDHKSWPIPFMGALKRTLLGLFTSLPDCQRASDQKKQSQCGLIGVRK